VAAVRFEEQRDRWMDRCGRGDVLADELLLSLAPREYRGVVDWYWLAAAHVALAGVAVSPGIGAHPLRESPSMPTPIRTQTKSKADLLQRRIDMVRRSAFTGRIKAGYDASRHGVSWPDIHGILPGRPLRPGAAIRDVHLPDGGDPRHQARTAASASRTRRPGCITPISSILRYPMWTRGRLGPSTSR
jgi:hypothetical protein